MENIRFNWNRINTDEYAQLNESIDQSSEFQIEIHVAFAYFKDERIVASRFKCVFIQADKPSLLIAVSAYFNIHPEDWKEIYNEKNGVVLPLKSAQHLASLTASTARGILHTKTEGGHYNKIIVPPININEIIKSDVIMKPRSEETDSKVARKKKA